MAESSNDIQSQQGVSEQDGALDRLNVLVGEWVIEGVLPHVEGGEFRGKATFEWLEGGSWLIMRSGVAIDSFPSVISIIGRAGAGDDLELHHFDSRGISRIYNMSLRDGVWRQWRDDPDFAQRFEGTFSEDGRTITAHWDIMEDGKTWKHDFDLTYRKIDA